MNFLRAVSIILISAIFILPSLSLYYLLGDNQYLFMYVLPLGMIVINVFHIMIIIKLVSTFQIGKWRYLFYVPFINGITYFLLIQPIISTLNIPMIQDSEDYGLGLLLIAYLPLHWIVFIIGFLRGNSKKKSINNKV
ncbi:MULTISPECIES: hypothetical protein [unclassified Bacillus (in: firmicutes)]|uniref:hypothetical protein n=1 Tax=unclassified Bacillus (in: firmicutes) TaxID=185979 RepID=UPI0008E511BA|nr:MULTISPECIES: hypothetical protein [unclassified Bacillus (in: firmicutes)]SFA90060.1 hypothetical protein SAMN02799634_102450 [Bacillus sp. UNCCL13]SFQ85128.1 hypothetical protein SAMN04488577_2570 [Bacillus sp. cl95]